MLEPAAHLDPGPEGHNVYGKVGHALAMVSVSLDTPSTLQRLTSVGKERCSKAEQALLNARRLLTQYFVGVNVGTWLSINKYVPIVLFEYWCFIFAFF